MALSYTPALQNLPPYSPQQRAGAIAALTAAPPYAVNRNQSDVMASLGGRAAAQMDLDTAKANTDYSLAQRDAYNNLRLQGMRQQADAEQNQQSLRNTRLQNMYNLAGGILGALLR